MEDFLKALLDHSIQVRLFKIDTKDDMFADSAKAAFEDVDYVSTAWQKYRPAILESGVLTFGAVLESVATMVKAVVVDGKDASPAAVCSAIQVVHKAGNILNAPFKMAEAFYHHAGPRKVLQHATRLVTVNLKDVAAVEQVSA